MSQLISTGELAKLFRTNRRHILAVLRASGIKPTQIHNRAYSFSIPVIDAWIAAYSQNYGDQPTPTVDDLRADTTSYLTVPELTVLIKGLSPRALSERAHYEGSIFCRFAPNDHFCLYDSNAVMQVAVPPEGLTSKQVIHVLSISHGTFFNDGLSNRIDSVSDTFNRKRRIYTRASLVAYLEGLIVNTDPEAWINERLADPYPLLSIDNAAKYAGIPVWQLTDRIAELKLSHIVTPRLGKIRLPNRHIIPLIEREPLNNCDIASVCRVPLNTAGRWRNAGLLTCREGHSHTDEGVYLGCFTALLQRLNPRRRIILVACQQQQPDHKKISWSLAEASRFSDVPIKTLLKRIEDGTLPHLITPDGEARIFPRSLQPIVV